MVSNKNKYEIEKIINKIINSKSSYFLDNKKIDYIKKILDHEHISYNIFYPFINATYGIIYTCLTPPVKVIKIESSDTLTHSSIMGSLFSLNINRDIFGDIIISNNYYVVVIDYMAEYIINNIYEIGRSKVRLKLDSLDSIKDFTPKIICETYTVSSERIDAIISRIIGTSRNNINELFKSDSVILNYDICNKIDYILKKGDIFSIRRHGKYKYLGINSISKKDKLIIEVEKYVD